MPMKFPSHPGLLLREDIEALGLTIAEAAAGLAVTRQQLYRILRGDSAVTAEMALRIEAALGGAADLWLRMQVAHDLSVARRARPKLKIKRLLPKAA